MVTRESPQLRRIALLARGEQLDLVVPTGDVLAHAITAAGVHLGPGDRVMGPEGSAIDPATAAEKLREGGLYAVTAFAREVTRSESRPVGVSDEGRSLPWALSACGLTAVIVALTTDRSGSRIVAAVVLALAAVFALLVWALRSTEKTKLYGCAAPLMLGVAAGALSVPTTTENYGSFSLAMGAAGAAILASLMLVIARAERVRASAAPIVVIAALVAAFCVIGPMLMWEPAQLALVISGLSVLSLRALPTMLVKVDEGYHIDYGKFMVLRWTVRGRVPQYVSRVNPDQITQLMHNAEARLQTSTVMLSLLAGIGIPAAVLPLAKDGLTERIAAIAFLMLAIVGLLTTSRRTVAPELRNPPRFAVVIGVAVFTVLFAVGTRWELIWLAAAVLAVVGLVVAVLSVSLLRGSRSLGWSRAGDVLDSLAIALVFPAALVAAGTLELLRGVLS